MLEKVRNNWDGRFVSRHELDPGLRGEHGDRVFHVTDVNQSSLRRPRGAKPKHGENRTNGVHFLRRRRCLHVAEEQDHDYASETLSQYWMEYVCCISVETRRIVSYPVMQSWRRLSWHPEVFVFSRMTNLHPLRGVRIDILHLITHDFRHDD